MSTTESNGAPAPPPPPPMPGTVGAPNVLSYKETKQKNDEIKKSEAAKLSMQDSQFANLPDKLMNTMKREKKPFTYTPLSVGDNGKLDLSQIKSPKMKKRLLANMKDEEEQDENKIESIDSSIENNKNQDKLLERELSSPIGKPLKTASNQQSSGLSDPTFSPSVQTKPSLVVPLAALSNNDYQSNGYSNENQASFAQPLSSYDYNRPLSPADKLDQLLNEQLHRPFSPDMNNNYTPSFYDRKPQQHYGNVKPKKIDILQELSSDRNFNCVPSQYNSDYSDYSNFNQTPKQWSNNNTSYSIPVEVQKTKSPQQYYSNSPTASYSPAPFERSKSQQGSYQIPVINENSTTNQTKNNPPAPPPPQRQQSLNRNYENEREIPVQYEEPIQSRSFKILQKLTADIEDEIDKLKVIDQQTKAAYRDPLEDKLPAYYGTLNHIEQPRERRSERRIPIQVDNSFSSSFSQPEYHSKNEQDWYLNSRGDHLSFANTSTPSSSGLFWSQPDWIPRIPASKQPQISTPQRYQGSNNPSRSFRVLQMLADDADFINSPIFF